MRFSTLGIVFCATCVIAQAKQDPAPQSIPVKLAWQVSIDAQGHVADLQPIANKKIDRVPQIRDGLEQAIRKWQFAPATIAGQPAPTETRLSVAATLLPEAGDVYRIRIDQAHTGGWAIDPKPPSYPREAVHEHHVGRVVVRISYDAEGKITSATVADSTPRIDSMLVKASLNAVEQWRFHPETVAGHGVPGTVLTPFCYSITDLATGHFHDGCKWQPPGAKEPLEQGDMLALNPAAQLQTDVAGKIF